MSSSESDDDYQHVQIPQVSLEEIRNKPHRGNIAKVTVTGKNLTKAAGSNFTKVTGKKFPGTKSVRFPDSYTPSGSMMNNSSTTNNSSDSEYELEDADHLPNFAHRDVPKVVTDEDEESMSSEMPDFRVIEAAISDSESDSDENRDGPEKSGKDKSESECEKEKQLSDSSRKDSDSEKNYGNPGKDAANDSNEKDSKKYTPSASYNDSQIRNAPSEDITESRSTGTFKSILRKMSLANQAYTEGYAPEQPSTSDTFLGKVLNFSKDGGITSGGLAPGATRASHERELDEEEKVGMSQEQHGSIEMKPLSLNQLDPEARKLITSHIPESEATMAHSDSESTSEGFYAPNPDIFLGREALNEAGDDFLLDEGAEDDYVAPPKKVHAGVLSSLLRLYQNPNETESSSTFHTRSSIAGSTLMEEDSDISTNTSHRDLGRIKDGLKKAPRGIMNAPMATAKGIKSVGSHGIKKASSHFRSPTQTPHLSDDDGSEYNGLPSFQNAKPKQPKSTPQIKKKKGGKKKKHRAAQLRITVHISDILQRQRFIMRMCRALMLFGAPTHRLEEYMVMTSRVLEIDGQFIYFPGCMIVSFGDAATRTSEVHLIRCAQGVNLSKLSDTHRIYKAVIHDLIGVEEAAKQLEELLRSPNAYPPWMCVFFYGLGSAMVCPFAFGGHWLDMPIAFGIGLCVGYLQFIVSAMSNLYSSVFEVTASIVVAFIARAIGSIKGGSIFCFSGIAQGSLALILPGYIILTGSLELQSRNLVAGSVRMFYAIIYSLFLGFGITLGGALYGWVDHNAVSSSTCPKNMDDKWRIFFVPMFAMCLGLINQARLHQLPVMIIIASVGYIGNYFAGKHFSSVTEFTACIGAFIVGILGNLYSRVGKGMAVSAMLPAIFVQVPSGIASQSSLVSGIQTADQITKTNMTSTDYSSSRSGSMAFGVTMVEVSIGISVGLFAAALCVYPFGKKRTGLFTL